MSKLFCLAILVAVASAGHVKFLDCAHHEVNKLDISDCSGDYCVIHKEKPLMVDATIKANQDAHQVNLKITAKVDGLEMQVPGVERNACHFMKCPLQKIKSYDFHYGIFVPKMLPNVKANVTVQLSGNHGILACLTFKGEVSDSTFHFTQSQ